MADLTHVLEGLLDEVRRGTRDLSADMVDVILRAKDALLGMLAAHKGKGVSDAALAATIKARLETLAAEPTAARAERKPPEETRHWTLYLELDPLADVDIDAVLESLAEHGDLSVVQRGETVENLPWVAVFTSPLDAAEVAESLAFAVPQDSFRINVDHGVEEEGSFGLFLEASPEPDNGVWLEGTASGSSSRRLEMGKQRSGDGYRRGCRRREPGWAARARFESISTRWICCSTWWASW